MQLLTLSDVGVTTRNLRRKLRKQRRTIARKLRAAGYQRLVDAVDERYLGSSFRSLFL